MAFLAASTSSCDKPPEKVGHAIAVGKTTIQFDDEGQAMWNCATKAANTLSNGTTSYDPSNRTLDNDEDLEYQVDAQDAAGYSGSNAVYYNPITDHLLFMSTGFHGRVDMRASSFDFNKSASIRDMSVRNLEASPEARVKLDQQYSKMMNNYITCLKPQG